MLETIFYYTLVYSSFITIGLKKTNEVITDILDWGFGD